MMNKQELIDNGFGYTFDESIKWYITHGQEIIPWHKNIDNHNFERTLLYTSQPTPYVKWYDYHNRECTNYFAMKYVQFTDKFVEDFIDVT